MAITGTQKRGLDYLYELFDRLDDPGILPDNEPRVGLADRPLFYDIVKGKLTRHPVPGETFYLFNIYLGPDLEDIKAEVEREVQRLIERAKQGSVAQRIAYDLRGMSELPREREWVYDARGYILPQDLDREQVITNVIPRLYDIDRDDPDLKLLLGWINCSPEELVDVHLKYQGRIWDAALCGKVLRLADWVDDPTDVVNAYLGGVATILTSQAYMAQTLFEFPIPKGLGARCDRERINKTLVVHITQALQNPANAFRGNDWALRRLLRELGIQI